jgi:hypothetical protein
MYLDIDPMASRNLSNVVDLNSPYFINLFLNNVGGFEFIYSLPLITISFAAFKNSLVKFLTLMLSLLFLLLIIKSQYTIAIIIQIYSILIFLLLHKYKFNTFLKRLIILILFIALFRYQISTILVEISYLFDSSIIKQRILALSEIIIGDFSSEESIRIDLYLSDLNTFFKSPFFGSLFKYNYTNNHSQFFSNLAKFGIFYFYLFIQLCVKISRIMKSRNSKIESYYIFTIFLISIINPIYAFFYCTIGYATFINFKNE